MSESPRTKADLIAEIADLKQKIKKLEKSEAKHQQVGSQRAAAHAAIQESEEQYRATVNSVDDIIHVVDRDLRILLFNEAFTRCLSELGVQGNIQGKGLFALFPFLPEKVVSEYQTVLKTASMLFSEDATLIGTAIRWTETRKIPIKDKNGKTCRIVTFIRDITERKQSEEALRNSEEKYRGLTENINLGIYRNTGGPEGKFIEANPAIIAMFGYKSREEFLAVNVSELYQNPEDRNKFNAKMLKEGFVRNEELWLKRKDGSLFVGSVSAVAVKAEGGQAKYYDGIIDNIDERKRVESQREAALEALRESEERFRQLSSLASEGIMIHEGGVILDANQAFAELAGYLKADNLIGKNGVEIISFTAESRQRIIDSLRTGSTETFEVELVKSDGSILSAETHGKEINYRGRQASLVSMRDITKRKQAEVQREAALAALRESEDRQQLILATLPIAIYTSPLDPAIDTSWISGDVEKVTGFTVEQYLAEKDFWRNRLHADDRERVLYAYKNPQAEDVIVLEYRWLCKDGNYKWFHDRTVKKRTQQGIQYFGIILDISERKRAEEEKRILEERLQWAEKMEAIGTLAGGIAHDFNNLLTGIQGYASMTLTNLDPAHPNYERLKRIEEQVQSGADLTSQLLGFARGGRYEVKPTDMNEIIEKTSSMFGRTKKEIAIQRKHGKDLWSVEVDRGQMEQVFVNLYVNAWQAMPGGGDIYLETENVLLDDEKTLPFSVKPGKYVKITVADTGIGIDEKTRGRIFDPFFTTKEMGRGIGLGLASVYGIIKGHRGMINVYSEPGHGTIFTIYLPASEKEVVKEKTAAAEIVMGTETILLVDDEKVVVEVSRELLESMGYKVYAAGSGQEGIAIYMEKRNEIDLVILDMIMPELAGGETFDRLREINPGVKVLLSSGYSLNGEAQHIMNRGCNGFLQKPFQIEKLSRKIRETLEL